jgi:hypothetical protein
MTGVTVTGINTTFNSTLVGKIIYFKVAKFSAIINAVINSNTLTVISGSQIPTLQSYNIYNSGVNIDANGKLGIGTSLQTSTMHLEGSFASGVIKITYADTVAGVYDLTGKEHHTFLIDASGGQITMNLTPLSNTKGRIYNFKKIDTSTNIVIINGYNSELIDQVAQYNLTIAYQCIIIQSSGETGTGRWYVISAATVRTNDLGNTDYLDEGSLNLYYTDQRVLDAINLNITTNDIAEGTSLPVNNLYFTDDRAKAAVNDLYVAVDTLSTAFDPIGSAAAVQSNVTTTLTNLTTDDITEGATNLYCSNTNVATAISNQVITQTLRTFSIT